MHHHHQLELYSISDVKLVELLLEQLRQSMIKLARVAGDARSSIEQSLQLFSDSVWSSGAPARTELHEEGKQRTSGTEIWKRCGQQDTSTVEGRWRRKHRTEMDGEEWSVSCVPQGVTKVRTSVFSWRTFPDLRLMYG